MKKQFLFLASVLTALIVLTQPIFAHERMAEPSMNNSAQNSSDIFGLTVLGSGDLEVKPGKVFTEGFEEGATLPYLIGHAKSIKYPAWAIRQGWQGTTTLALEILPNGEVGRTMVMKSSGRGILDKAAMKAVIDWKFQPAMKNGKGIVSCIQVPVSFELK